MLVFCDAKTEQNKRRLTDLRLLGEKNSEASFFLFFQYGKTQEEGIKSYPYTVMCVRD